MEDVGKLAVIFVPCSVLRRRQTSSKRSFFVVPTDGRTDRRRRSHDDAGLARGKNVHLPVHPARCAGDPPLGLRNSASEGARVVCLSDVGWTVSLWTADGMVLTRMTTDGWFF